MIRDDVNARVVLTIDKTILRNNFRNIAVSVAPCRILSVLKADAYGTGAAVMAPLAVECGADRIGVADLCEALSVQKSIDKSVPVQILGVILPDELPDAVANDIVLPVNGLAMAKSISAEAVRQKRQVRVHIILDTGMGRFGCLPDFFLEDVKNILRLPNLQIEGLYSHFPCAGIPGEAETLAQIRLFNRQYADLVANGIDFACRHIAASDGILCQPDSCQTPFNMVRLGLCWYGCYRNKNGRNIDIVPALTLTARVGAVRKLPAGFTIGYNRTVRLTKDTVVATICAGYADGLPLALSNTGRVLINGVGCPILGRVSIDYTMVDVSHVPGTVGWGTPVTLFGRDGNETISVAEIANYKNTHIHEILCSLGKRVQRVYV